MTCPSPSGPLAARFLALQGQSAEAALREQASLLHRAAPRGDLDVTNDTVFSRGPDEAITYWNHPLPTTVEAPA